MIRPTTALQIILLYELLCIHAQARTWSTNGLAYRYFDRYLFEINKNNDMYFDRIVGIVLNISNWKNTKEKRANLTPGVLIDSDRVLTSYNPYRPLIRDKSIFERIVISVLEGRRVIEKDKILYYTRTFKIACGRQVAYLPDEDIGDHLWHGKDRKHSPLHDLMVIRILGNVTFSTLKPYEHPLHNRIAKPATEYKTGIFRTEIAKPGDVMGASFKFAFLGVRKLFELGTTFYMHRLRYEREDDALVDCENWLPNDWGYFICIKNYRNYPAIGSGSMLVSNGKVFGVGSFALFRGKTGILVFTDVRPYHELIFNACTYSDSDEKPPKQFL